MKELSKLLPVLVLFAITNPALSQKVDKVGKAVFKAMKTGNADALNKVLPSADQVVAYSESLDMEMDTNRLIEYYDNHDKNIQKLKENFSKVRDKAAEAGLDWGTAKLRGSSTTQEEYAKGGKKGKRYTVTLLLIHIESGESVWVLDKIGIFSLKNKWYIGNSTIKLGQVELPNKEGSEEDSEEDTEGDQ